MGPPGQQSGPPLFPRLRWVGVGWLLVWTPTYAAMWGWRNFLQLCDLAVFLTCVGLWRGSPLLLSSQAVGSLVIDGIWGLDAGARLLTGRHLVGGTEYMFDAGRPLAVRMLSLFHLVLPPLLLWSLSRAGYDRRGWKLQAAIATAAMIGSRLLTAPGKNQNFAFRDPFFHRSWGPAPLHLAVSLAVLVAVAFLPTHLALSRLFKPARR
jgi:hypothetical protein